MQPLFSAVAHGCAAGLYQEALYDVYWTRVYRENEKYIIHKLGAFSDDLAAVSHFFTTPWRTPTTGLTDADKAVLLNFAGFGLRALGRLREAVELMQADIAMAVKQKDWRGAAQAASNLSALQLTLGDITKAASSAAQSVAYADKSGDWSQRMINLTTHAHALHQTGEFALADELFQAAEALQREHQPDYPRLYSLQGFKYCDLQLAQEDVQGVLERYEQWVEWRQDGDSILDRSLEYLIAGRAHLQRALNTPSGSLSEAEKWLEQAVVGLRAAGVQDYLSRGLLARAVLFRHSHDFDRARQDLQEVFDMASLSGMHLFLADYHLEMGRLLLEETERKIPSVSPERRLKSKTSEAKGSALQQTPNLAGGSPTLKKGEQGGFSTSLQHHITEATRLINETGYHRRDRELADLQQASSTATSPNK